MSTPSLVAKRPRPCSLSRGDARANATPELSPRSRSHGSSAGRREVSSSSIVLTSADVGTREETPKRWLARTGPARSTRALPAWVVRIRKAKGNWRRRASIPVPLACEASALPIELRPLDRCQGSVHRASSLKLGWQVLVNQGSIFNCEVAARILVGDFSDGTVSIFKKYKGYILRFGLEMPFALPR